MAEKKKLETHVSPRGTAAFAWIDKADTKFKPEGEYKVSLILDKGVEENEAFVKRVNKAHDAARGKKKTESPAKDGDESDKEEFHGKYEVRFKSKYQPKVVDAKRQQLNGEVKVYSGDVIKVAFAVNPYEHGKNAGVSLQLRAVQLLEKKNFGADYSGAFEEEDGFSADDTNEGSESGDGKADLTQVDF